MTRQTDLEKAIRESYAIIHEYEAIIRTSGRPEEELHAQDKIKKHWSLINGYLDEYACLTPELPPDIAQIAARFLKDNELTTLKVPIDTVAATLRDKYLTRLFECAVELYNKLNDIVGHRDRVLRLLENAKITVENIQSVNDIVSSSGHGTYLVSVVYLFARYFACVEAIKQDIGSLPLARTRQTIAVFFSGRLHSNIKIREPHRLKYEGRIIEGARTLIGEAMLKPENGSHTSLSFSEFCNKLAIDNNFRQCLAPLLDLLDDLEEVSDIDYFSASDVDFRWVKLILFASSLRGLVQEIDIRRASILLPDLERYERKFLLKHPKLQENIAEFKRAYPDRTVQNSEIHY